MTFMVVNQDHKNEERDVCREMSCNLCTDSICYFSVSSTNDDFIGFIITHGKIDPL